MYSDENRSVALAKYLNGFDYAVIDTCSLMEDSFAEWMDVLTNAKIYLANSKVRIYIIDECIEELKKHSKNKEDFDRSVVAKRALKIIRQAKWKRLLKIRRSLSKNDRHFADPAIYTQISADHITKKILAITQDKKLASDIRSLNRLQSQHGFQVEVCQFIPGGNLVPNKGEDRRHLVQSSKSSTGRGLRSAAKEASEKPSKTNTPRRPSPDEILNAIIAADTRLSAVLNNENYPAEKKLADIENQLKELKNLSEEKRKSLSLLLPEPKLNEALISLKQKMGILPPPAPKPAPSEGKTLPKVEAKSEADVKENWYGKGPTIKEAVAAVASHHGLMFRYRTIPYQASFHGPADLTDEDLENIATQMDGLVKGPEKVTSTYKGMEISIQPNGVGFRAWLKLKAAQKPAPAPVPAQEEEKPVIKKAKPHKAAAKPEKEEEFGHPRLVVMAPEPSAAPAKKKTAPKKPAAEKLEKPTKPKTAKPAAEKLEKPSKPATKKPAAEKLAKPGKPSEEQPTDPQFLEILAHEKILKANLHNPKVTPQRVIEDIKKQIELQHGMPHSYAKYLRFTIKELQELLKSKKQPK